MFSHGFSLSFSDAQSLYKTNESSGNLIDYSANQFIGDLPQTGTVGSQTGRILGARGTFSSSDYFSKSSLSMWDNTESFSISLWVQATSDSPATNQMLITSDSSGNGDVAFWLQYTATDVFRFALAKSGDPVNCDVSKSVEVNSGQWYHLVAIYGGGANFCSIYVNNTNESTVADMPIAGRGVNFYVGILNDGNSAPAIDFYIEQIAVFNKSLDSSEVDWLWNNGTGQNYTAPGNSTSIALNYPDDNALNTTTRTINFGYTPAFYGGNPQNCSLYTNEAGVWNQTEVNNTVLGNGTVNIITHALGLNGNYTWGIGCWDETLLNFSENRTLNIDVPNVTTISLNYPDDNVLNTTIRTISFGYTPTFYGGKIQNCSLYDNSSGTWSWKKYNQTAIVNASANLISYTYPGDNVIIWSIGCWDELSENFTSNRTLILNLTRNATAINIIFPTSVYQNSENQVKANITDLITNLSVTFGTMSINLTKADSTSIKENMTYDSAESLWLSGNHTFDVQGLWTLVLDYYGEDLFANSANSSNVTVNVVPVAVSSVGGGGGGNCYYNWTCSEWAPAKCPESGKQTRQCVNKGTCRGTSGKPSESQSCEYTSPIPKQLLDVKLTLESNRLIDSTKLTSLTTFQSFGKTPAEVNLTYTFLDSSGKQIYNETDQRTVYTELALQRKFGKLVLGAGNYSLVLVLQYVNVTEKFRQDFEVLPTEMQQAFLAEGGFGIYVLAFSFVLAFIFAFYSYQLMTKFKKDKSEIEKLESETEEPKQKQIRFK
jgi:hypothetical protein